MAKVNDTWINEVTDDTVISQVDNEIRDTRQAFYERFGPEHVTAADSSSTGLASEDGYHLPGSAKVYAHTGEAPTDRPNGVPITSDDKGRVWIDETADTNAADDLRAELKYYHPTHKWKPPNYFSDKVFFPKGISVGGVEVTGTGFDGFLGVNTDNQIIGFTGDLEIDSSRGIIPTTDGESHLGDSDHAFSEIHGDAVYGAVGNDYGDEIEGLLDAKEFPGKCYVQDKRGIRLSMKRAEKGTLGIATDSASFLAQNKSVGGKKVKIAVSGFPMAFVDGVYPAGTALVAGKWGVLTRARFWEKILFPERIVAIYIRKLGVTWGTYKTQGRSLVRVV